ncbi:hypothetical protein ONS96_010074 [Cadophora gregata f. sp. sojae]|nr:hypothetical protein ONS96_010074 [Cadophora gregata f. sp. sojae]
MNCGSFTTPITIDGQLMTRPNISKSSYAAYFSGNTVRYPMKRKVLGAHVDVPSKPHHQLLKKFKFSKIETSVDDEKLRDVKEDAKRMDQVGEIFVVFHRCADPVSSRSGNSRHNGGSMPTANVHEKALKGQAKTHTTSLGAGSLVEKKHVHSVKLDGEDYPQAIFRFKYRSRGKTGMLELLSITEPPIDALKSLLIIERTPSPEPEGISVSASPVRHLKSEVGTREGVKTFHGMNDNVGLSVKRECDDGGEGSLRKKRKSGQSITIDLTEDTDDEDIICIN